MGTNLQSILAGFLKLALLAGSALYAGVVLTTYYTDGRRSRPRLDPGDPVRSAQYLAIWLGVEVYALIVRMARAVFAMLSEASAEVGEWVLEHRRQQTR